MISIKICGITQREQAQNIAKLGVDYLGFILVPHTPRYVCPSKLADLTANLNQVKKIGVFRHHSPIEIKQIVINSGLDGVQLHGQESLSFCQQLKELLPDQILIKAIGVKQKEDLILAESYSKVADIILLDVPGGGTGKRIDWQILHDFRPTAPWWLAGGINPDNVKEALTIKPDGLDLSSGVEDQPGIKNIDRIKSLLAVLT